MISKIVFSSSLSFHSLPSISPSFLLLPFFFLPYKRHTTLQWKPMVHGPVSWSESHWSRNSSTNFHIEKCKPINNCRSFMTVENKPYSYICSADLSVSTIWRWMGKICWKLLFAQSFVVSCFQSINVVSRFGNFLEQWRNRTLISSKRMGRIRNV